MESTGGMTRTLWHRSMIDATAFDDNGAPIATTDFEYPSETTAAELLAEDAARIRRETITRLVSMLASRGDRSAVGGRLLLLAFLLRCGGCKTQRALAKKLRVSEARVSQSLKSLREEMAMLAE